MRDQDEHIMSYSYKLIRRFSFLIALGAIVLSCVEPFEVETEDFVDALVIDATITNEIKQQQILLSRTFLLEEFDPVAEENANVKIIDDVQNEYVFQEIEAGRYVSINAFSAQGDNGYQLLVTLQNGNSYTSEIAKLPPTIPIDDLSVSRRNNENGADGVSIALGVDPTQGPQYFRYEYEEAYKIIAPKWTGERLVFSGSGPPVVFPIEQEERICYAENASKGIILGSTLGPTGTPLTTIEVRFINGNNTIISHRYSILVKQFGISKEAYDYFELLKRFSGQGNILSQTQPGFFNSNIYSTNDNNQKVLGYFDVSAVTTKRVFFDYVDFFPNEALPPYAEADCDPFVANSGTSPTLANLLNNNLVRYYSMDLLTEEVLVVPRICADCTVLGSPVAPEFWEE